jgi:hypothetical protein
LATASLEAQRGQQVPHGLDVSAPDLDSAGSGDGKLALVVQPDMPPSLRAVEIDEHFIPCAVPEAHVIEIDGEAVVLDERESRVHVLNATGALLWRCFDGTSTLREVAGEIADAVGMPLEVVVADSVALARKLGAQGLLVDVEPEDWTRAQG